MRKGFIFDTQKVHKRFKSLMALKLSLRSRGKNGDTKHKDGEVTMKTCF